MLAGQCRLECGHYCNLGLHFALTVEAREIQKENGWHNKQRRLQERCACLGVWGCGGRIS